MKFFDLNDPFYKPLWIRIVLTAFLIGWALFEISTGAVFWAILFGAAGSWCAFSFFFSKPSQ